VRIPFNSSPRTSLGIEWELQLIDPATRELASAASEILADLSGGDEEHPKAKHELFESTVEVITAVCMTVGEAKADLAATLAEVVEAADRRGLGVMCSGTHPLSAWPAQQVSPNPRYAKLIEHMQWMARRLQIFGVHVHVGIRSPEKAIPIVNALTSYVPHFLALSASSPFWQGRDTGLASSRSKIFEGLPTAGLPVQLSDWTEFERLMATLVASGTIESIREVWWDIRPHPGFGTVELRICDGLPTLQEIGAVAALAQCLVDQLNTQLDRGYQLPRPNTWVQRENKWRAARHGLEAEIILDEHGTTRPLREAIAELVHDLGPLAQRLGCTAELHDVLAILEAGASYERQRKVAADNGGDVRAVVDRLLAEMKAGRLSPTSGGAPEIQQ
jgi:carboxylate-amine ligase